MYEKTYLYKVYRNGTYLGLLPQPSSDFGYAQDINTAGSEIVIEVPITADTSSQAPDPIETEDSNPLQTESGETLTTERQPDAVGDNNTNGLIRHDNDIHVYEFSTNNPNGIKVFEGSITKWKAGFNNGNDSIEVTVISYGVELDNYVSKAGGTTQISQLLDDQSEFFGNSNGGPTATYQYVGQSFQPTSSYSIDKISCYLANNSLAAGRYIRLSLYEGTVVTGDTNPNASGTLLAQATAYVTNAQPTYQFIDFSFSELQAVISGTNYFFVLEDLSPVTGSGASTAIARTSTSAPYAAGSFLIFSDNDGDSGTPQRWTVASNRDMRFKISASTGNTTVIYDDTNPSTMVTEAVASATSQGSHITYTGSSVETTAFLADYTFIVATILEVIKKALELAPSGWYWYVDVGSSVLNFKQTHSTADHTMILGRHLNSIELESSVEQVKNLALFTGGDIGGGVNLYNQYVNQDSIDDTGKQKLVKLSDNRVTVNATAALLAQNYLDEHSEQEYSGSITLPDSVYDISTIDLGDTIGFSGFGTFIDGLVLQVVRKAVSPNSLTINLGRLPIRTPSYIEEIKRDLEKEQTLANPSAPS